MLAALLFEMPDKSASQQEHSTPDQVKTLKTSLHPLLWILIAGVAVRILLLVWFAGLPLDIHDERDYNALAVNLVETGQYSLDGHKPVSMRPPLYPAFVAGVYRLAGVENFQAVRILQAVISLLNVILLYCLASEIYNRQIGTWAAGLFCFYPTMLGQNNLLLTETLFTFWLTLVCLAVVRLLGRDSLGYVAAAGVLIGLAALTRSILWLFPPVLAVFIIVFWKQDFRRRLAAVGLLICTFAVTIAPWAIRNTRLHHTLVTIDVMGGRNFMMGNYEHTPMWRAWDAISMKGKEAWHHVLRSNRPELGNLTQGQLDKAALRCGLQFVLDHPWLTLRRDIVKFFTFWQLERSFVAGMGQGFFGGPPVAVIVLLTIVIFGAYAAAVLLGIFGAVMVPPQSRPAYWFLLLVIAYMCGLHSLVFAHSRYHLPLVPLVLIFSAAAAVNFREIWQRRSTRQFRTAACLGGLLACSWVWRIVAGDFHRYWDIL